MFAEIYLHLREEVMSLNRVSCKVWLSNQILNKRFISNRRCEHYLKQILYILRIGLKIGDINDSSACYS